MTIQYSFRKSATAFALLFMLLLCTSVLQAEPLTQEQLSGLIKAGFPTSEVKEMVENRGYSGSLEGENLKTLREAGADADLIAYLMTTEAASPHSTAKPQAQERLFRFSENGKFGFSDQSGRVIIQPQWEDAEDFSEGLAWVRNRYQFAYIDTTGRVIIELQSSGTLIFSEGLAVLEKDGKYGYIDKTGRFVIEPQWASATAFSEGLAVVIVMNTAALKYGYIDKAGRVVIEPQWDIFSIMFGDGGENFSEGLATVMQDGKFGYIDKTGSVVIEARWDGAKPFTNGLAIVVNDEKYGFIDKTGHVAIEPQWDRVRAFSEGLALVGKDKKFGFIDKTGRVVIEPKWDEARPFSEGLAVVVKDGKYGFIDKTGRMVVPPQWDTSLLWEEKLAAFSEGLAVVKKDGKHGYIDKSGRVVIDLEWDDAKAFSGGFAVVSKGDNIGAIDKTGKVVAGFGKAKEYQIDSGIQNDDFTARQAEVAGRVIRVLRMQQNIAEGFAYGYKDEADYQVALALNFHRNGVPALSGLADLIVEEMARGMAVYLGLVPDSREREEYIKKTTASYRGSYRTLILRQLRDLGEK